MMLIRKAAVVTALIAVGLVGVQRSTNAQMGTCQGCTETGEDDTWRCVVQDTACSPNSVWTGKNYWYANFFNVTNCNNGDLYENCNSRRTEDCCTFNVYTYDQLCPDSTCSSP